MSSTKKTVIKFTSKQVCFEYLSIVRNSTNSKDTLFSSLKNGFTKFLNFLSIIFKNITQIHVFWALIKIFVFYQNI